MKIHTATIDTLIALYETGHRILQEAYGTSINDEEASEAAAIDYLTSNEHARFCGIIDNLDEEAGRELIALMLLGQNQDQYGAADFDRLKNEVRPEPETGDQLFGEKCLPDYWRAGLRVLGAQ